MSQTITSWEFGAKVEAPCADISFASLLGYKVRILMHFSLVRDGMPNDLEIVFDKAYALTWHEESLHSISVRWPKPLPRLEAPKKWKGWTYPFLEIHDSDWLKQFSFMPRAKGLVHVALVAMNDIVELVASPTPAYQWLSKHEA